MSSLSCHIDTLRPSLLQGRQLPADSEIFSLSDGDFLAFHYPVPLNPDRALLIIPGMASNRNAPIITSAARKLIAKNYTPIIVELRNCTDFPGKTSGFFNAGSVADLTEAINYLCEKICKPLSAIIGFSLGANVLVQWAARNTNSCRQTNFIHCVSLPLDLHITAEVANQGVNWIYQKIIISRHRQLLRRRNDSATLAILPKLDKIKRMYDFDEQITAPLNGYQSISQYYNENGALQYINDISIRCKITNSRNDPLIPDNGLYSSICRRPTLELNMLPYGGHLGLLHTSILRRLRNILVGSQSTTSLI